ncbi:MAG: hypothetical protein ABIV04_09260 [Massilia sp.]
MSVTVTLAIGLPLIAMLFMMLDPTAPLAYIVIPVTVGGLVPVFAALPARFEIITRFQAQHFARTLDETLVALGYAPRAGGPGAARHYARQSRFLRWKENEIAITVSEHAIAISGPIFTLRLLQQRLAA